MPIITALDFMKALYKTNVGDVSVVNPTMRVVVETDLGQINIARIRVSDNKLIIRTED